MTALAANRQTEQLDPDQGYDQDFTILNEEITYTGGMVAIDYLDEIQMASATEGLRVIGLNKYKKIDNAADGETQPVQTGIFLMKNSSTYPLVMSGIGGVCYAEDDQTVASFHATVKVAAGIVRDVVSAGVWVDMSPLALATARERTCKEILLKTAAYTLTEAQAFARNNIIKMTSGAAAIELTLPSAVAGMKFGVWRGSATATHDVTVQAAASDKIEGSDGLSAAGKQVDNTVDAVSEIIYFEAVDDTVWAIADPPPRDLASWVKNDA